MKKIFSLTIGLISSLVIFAQDVKTMQENARTFMRSGDFENAVLILNRALQIDKNNLELQKDLAMSLYLKRDYAKALEVVKPLVERNDADVICFQIAGNIYKALEEVKDCDRLYRNGLKKFPKSGPLHSEYGELKLAARDNLAAIQLWEKGIQQDPGYSGNYYNAALYYANTKDKVWTLIYGEIFVNMESLSERGAAMKELVFQGYKEKLFADVDLMKGEEKNKSEFARAFLQTMNKQSSLITSGITTETLSLIRSRFILDWFNNYAGRFPFKLFDYQRQLMQQGLFDAYNQWLFGPVENLAAYEAWTKSHSDQFDSLNNLQKNRVFKMPVGQYYQGN